MKFFNTTRAEPAETDATSARLSAIVDRGHSQSSVYPHFEDCEKVGMVRQHFGTALVPDRRG